MFAAGLAAFASIGAAIATASRKSVEASTRLARPVNARATAVSRTDRPSIFVPPPSQSPQGLQVERNATCTKKVQKKEHQFKFQSGRPVKQRAGLTGRRSPAGIAASADRDHPLDRASRAGSDLGLDRHLVLPIAERREQLFERNHLHVLADRPLGDGFEALSRRLLVQPVEDPGFGRDEEAALRRVRGEVDHSLGREDVSPVVTEGHALAGTPALGVDEQLGVGRLVLPALDVGGTDTGVDVAFAQPDGQLSPGNPLEPDPEEHVREKQDLEVGGNRLDNRFRVACGTAIVALGLDRGGRVSVRDDDGPRVLRLPVAQLLCRDRGRERAARVEVWDQHGLVRRQDLRGLGHEVDATEDDCLRVRGGGLAGQTERIADEVGHVLDLGNLVVVREDDGVSLARERLHLVLNRRDLGSGHATSMETSSARAEWVSAPIETKSTPVSAIARTFSSVTPPEASSLARPPVSATAGLSELDGDADRAGDAQVVVLDQNPVVEREPVVFSASAAHRIFLERAQSGRRLARIEDLRTGVGHRLDVASREGGDARQTAEQVERQALAREERTGPALESCDLAL